MSLSSKSSAFCAITECLPITLIAVKSQAPATTFLYYVEKGSVRPKHSVKTLQNNLISHCVITECNTQTSAERVEKPGNRYTAHTPIQ